MAKNMILVLLIFFAFFVTGEFVLLSVTVASPEAFFNIAYYFYTEGGTITAIGLLLILVSVILLFGAFAANGKNTPLVLAAASGFLLGFMVYLIFIMETLTAMFELWI